MRFRSGPGKVSYLVLAAAIVSIATPVGAQQTVGLFLNGEEAFDGYTLWAPLNHEITYLINNEGRLVHTWPSTLDPGFTPYLIDNGDIVRGAAGGGVQRIAWDGSLLWVYFYVSGDYRAHHDLEPLPNGNVLMIAWEYLTATDAIAAGRNPANVENELWPLHIVEVEPVGVTGGNIVWEWHVWDHLIQDFDPTKANFGVVSDHPELVDVNLNPGATTDWIHANGIDYNPLLDQIVISGHFVGEIWVIDHSTSTAEAAGHSGGNSGKGGDLLYRWGNPANYDRGAVGDRRLFGQHDARWVEAGFPGEGNLTVFNNGGGRPGGSYSTVDELTPPVDGNGNYTLDAGSAFGPTDLTWSYVSDPPFFAGIMCGAHRLPNGNTLYVYASEGEFVEVTPDSEVVWRYVNPVGPLGPVQQGDFGGNVFRIHRYAPDHPGFDGKSLIPGAPLESFNAPPPVADGTAGTIPMICSRASLDGTQIDCTWDAPGCPSWNYNLLFGGLAGVASYSLLGAECVIGAVGSHQWSGVPAGDLFFLIVGTELFGAYESSWGRDSSGAQRNGTAASNFCGPATKDVSSSCP